MMKDAQLISVVIEGIRFRICMSPLVSASALCLVMKGVQAVLCIHPLFTVMMKGVPVDLCIPLLFSDENIFVYASFFGVSMLCLVMKSFVLGESIQ
jgi:hypothetical protein